MQAWPLILFHIYIFDVDLDPTNIHPDHFLKGARNLILDSSAHFTDVDVLLENEIEICSDDIIFNRDANSITDPAFEKTVHSTRNLCHAADTWHTQC